eukprot:symbB.v1.2.001888.t1/scaffold101.1/size361152/2
MVEEDVHNQENGDGFADAVSHEICCKVSPREAHPTSPENWIRNVYRGRHLESTKIHVICMRKWGVTRSVEARHALFSSQSKDSASAPKHLTCSTASRNLDQDHDDAETHGASGNDALRRRAETVAEFFLKVCQRDLNQGSGVLDIAGGTGLLSLALAQRGVQTTVVDPRRSCGCLPSRARKVARKTGAKEWMASYRAYFGGKVPGADDAFAGAEDVVPTCAEESQLVQRCSALVALHPDEATEVTVEAALRWQKPFLVVPCCVFGRLFPHRRLADGRKVTTLVDFLDFLQAKHPSIRKTRLPFDGANHALWSDGNYDATSSDAEKG